MPLPKCVRVLEDDTQSREALEGDGWRYVETLVEMKRETGKLSYENVDIDVGSKLSRHLREKIVEMARENLGPNRFVEDEHISLKYAQKIREVWVKNWNLKILISTHPQDHSPTGFLLPKNGRLVLVAVDESHRRAGIGKQLVSAFITEAWREELESVRLGTQESNIPALALYRDMGFRTYRRRVTYHKDAS